MRGTLVFHIGVGSGSHFGTLHSQRSSGSSESTVTGHFLLEVPSHSCSEASTPPPHWESIQKPESRLPRIRLTGTSSLSFQIATYEGFCGLHPRVRSGKLCG